MLVEQALEDIPEPLAGYLENVMIEVEQEPDRAAYEAAGFEDVRMLLGLYRGTPLTERSVEHSGRLPDRITLYQRNIERACRSRGELVEQIRKTVFHEIGHHFGLDEDDLAEMGYE